MRRRPVKLAEPNLEFGDVSHDEDHHDEGRDAEFHPEVSPLRESDALSRIGFGDEILPTPAASARAEKHVYCLLYTSDAADE